MGRVRADTQGGLAQHRGRHRLGGGRLRRRRIQQHHRGACHRDPRGPEGQGRHRGPSRPLASDPSLRLRPPPRDRGPPRGVAHPGPASDQGPSLRPLPGCRQDRGGGHRPRSRDAPQGRAERGHRCDLQAQRRRDVPPLPPPREHRGQEGQHDRVRAREAFR